MFYETNTTKKNSKVLNLVVMKGSVLPEDITILNVYAPNNISTEEHTSKHIQQKFIGLKEIDNVIITAGDFNTPLSETEG